MKEEETTEIANMMANECMAMRLRYVNRVITGLYERALRALGVKISQAGIILLLSVRGESNPSEIGKVFQMEKSTVSRNVGRMKKNGWLEVTAINRQVSQTIKLTPKGRELLGAIYTQWKKVQEEAGELLGKEGVAALHALFDALRDLQWKQKYWVPNDSV